MGNFMSYQSKKPTKKSKVTKSSKVGGSNSSPEEDEYKNILLEKNILNVSNTTPLFYNYISLKKNNVNKNNNSSKTEYTQLKENPLLKLEGKTFVSIKGWGSGLTETNKAEFSFDKDIEKIELPEKFFIYWDGDNLKLDNYGEYIIKLCKKYK